MEINYHISPSVNTEDFIIRIYEAQAPDAEVATLTIAAPHTAPYSVSFTGLDKVPHILKMFGATSGTLLHSFDDLPTENVVSIFDDIKFKIGDGGALTPAAGTSAYIDPVLAGLAATDINVFRNGTFFYPTQYTFNPAGEIDLIYPDIFSDTEEFLVTRKPKAVTTQVNDSVVGKQFGGNTTIPEMFIDVTTTVNYTPSHLRHLIRLSGVNANYVLTGAIPIGYIFRVTNFGPYADVSDKGKVTFDNAPLLWGNTTKTSLDIQFTGTYEFEFDGTNWNCTMYNVQQETPGATIVYKGSVVLGTMSTADQLFTVSIPYMGVAPDYVVVANLVSDGSGWNADNDISWVICNKTSTSFGVGITRLNTVTKKFILDFIIVK
jgi:hypothetical protein